MKNKAKLFLLIPIIYFSVSGGPYGLEEVVSSIGPFLTLLLILVVPIIWTIPEALIVAELSSNYPVQGGYYRWVSMGLGRFWGFMEGWWSILYTLIDLSLYPILFIAYLKILFPELAYPYVYFIQLFIIWFCAFINILGIRSVGYVLTAFKLFILISFLVFIILCFNHSPIKFDAIFLSKNDIQFEPFLYGISLVFWNFIGWDNGTTAMGEVDEPAKTYPKALLITIPIVVLFYFFPILASVSLDQDWHNWHFGQFSTIAFSMGRPLLGVLLAVGGMVMCIGIFNALLLSSTRIFLCMSEDKFLHPKFAALHKQFQTPYFSILFSAVVYSVLIFVSFHNLIIYDVFLYLVAILLEAFALVSLRKKSHGKIKDTFCIPFGKLGMCFVVGLSVFIISLVILINLLGFCYSLYSTLVAFLLLFSGVPVYLWVSRAKSPTIHT